MRSSSSSRNLVYTVGRACTEERKRSVSSTVGSGDCTSLRSPPSLTPATDSTHIIRFAPRECVIRDHGRKVFTTKAA